MAIISSGGISGSSTSTGSLGRFSAEGRSYFTKGINVGTTGEAGTQLIIGRGTQAAPGLSFDGDPDTGFYQTTDNQLSLGIMNNQILAATYYNFDVKWNLRVGQSNDTTITYDGTKISGSAISTGSFGVLRGGNFRFIGDNDTGITLPAGNQLAITLNNAQSYTFALTEAYNSSGVRWINETPSATNPVFTINGYDDGLGGAANTAVLITNSLPRVIAYDGGVEFPTVNGQISGSATSTGSFGMITIEDSIGSPHKWFGHAYYLRTNSSLRIGGYIYADSTLNLDAGANDIRLGSSSGGANTVHFKTDGSTDGITITQNHITSSGNFSSSLASTGSFGSANIGGASASTHKLNIYNGTNDTRGLMIETGVATSYAEAHLKANREYRIGTGGASADSSAANNFYIYDATAAAHRLTVTSAGKFGMNETSPDNILHIKNTSGDNRQLKLESTVAASYVETHITTDAREWRIGAAGSGVGNPNKFYIYDATATAHRLDIDTSGNVIFPTANAKISGSSTSTGSFGHGFFASQLGVGTTSPSSNLIHGTGDKATTLRLDNTSSALNYILLKNSTSANNYIQTNASSIQLNADANGSSGIVDLMTNNTLGLRVDSSQRTFIGDQHTLNFSQDNATGVQLQIASTTNSTHQFGQSYANVRSEPAGIFLGRHNGTNINRYHMHQDSGSGAGADLGSITYGAFSMGGGGPTWHNAARLSVRFEDNPSTNTAPGTIDFRTLESYSADGSNPRTRMSVHGGSNAGEVTIYSGSLTLKDGNSSSPGNVSGSSTSTGSFGAGFFGGNVGIGTTTPAYPLQIQKPQSDNGAILQVGEGGFGAVVAGSTAGHTHAFFGNFKYDFADSTTSTALYTNAGEGINMDGYGLHFFATPNATVDSSFTPTEIMSIISETGKVGIGNSAPPEALSVTGDISASVDIHAGEKLYTGTNIRVGSSSTNGNASDPAITTAGDTNTGIYFGSSLVGIGGTGGLEVENGGTFGGNVALNYNNAMLSIGHGGESHWGTGFDVLEVGHSMVLFCETADGADRNAFIGNNLYYDASGFKRHYTDQSVHILFRAGYIAFNTDASGTAGAVFTPSERMRITEDGDTGIGTSDPDRLLHVHKASAGSVTAVSYTEFVIEDDGGSGMSILAPDANSGNIVFGFPSDNDSIQLRAYYNSGNPRLAVELAGSEKFNFIGNQFSGSAASTGSFGSVYTAGRVGIGTNNPLNTLHVQGGGIIKNSGADTQFIIEGPTGYDAKFVMKSDAGGALGDWWTFRADIDQKLYIKNGNTDLHAFTSAGLVGIGTTGPLAKLHVYHTTDDTDENGDIAFTVGGDSSGELRHYWGVNNSSNYGYYGVVEHATAYRPMVLQPNGSTVGIGVTAPVTSLDVHSAGTEVAAAFGMADDGNAYITTRVGEVQDRISGYMFMVGSAAVDGWSSTNATAGITSAVLNSGGSLEGDLRFMTNAGDSLAEDMRLTKDGTLHVDGDVIAYSTTISDKRVKDNVKTIEFGLDKIKNLRGVEFTWNRGSREGERDIGVIAQEVEKVEPKLVREHEVPLLDESGKIYKTVDYEKITAVLIEAVKEQQTQIDELKKEVEELKNGSSR